MDVRKMRVLLVLPLIATFTVRCSLCIIEHIHVPVHVPELESTPLPPHPADIVLGHIK